MTEQPGATHRRINEAGDPAPSSQDFRDEGRPEPAYLGFSCGISGPASPAKPAVGIPGDSRGRNNSPGSPGNTFAVSSEAQLPTPIGRLLMEGSCSILGKSMEVPGLCVLWHNQIAALSCMGHLPGQTTARASGRSGRRCGTRSATPSGLASTSRRTFGRQPASELPFRDVVLTERDKNLLPELRRASAMALPRCVVPRYATAWTESLEGAMRGHQSWALLCRCRRRLLPAEIPKGVERNSELKQRLQLWEPGLISVLIGMDLGQQNSGPLRRTARKTQPQTDEQRGKRACAWTARRSISKAVKGLVGDAAQGSADCRRNWTTALIPRSSGIGPCPTIAEYAEAARIAWGGGRYKLARSAMREQGRSKTGIASLPHVKLSPMSAPGPTGERQEHLDASGGSCSAALTSSRSSGPRETCRKNAASCSIHG